jgi:hypothetical protein
MFDVRGEDAELVMRRVLAYQHVAGAAERELRAATQLLESAGDPTRLVQQLATGRSFRRVPPTPAVAAAQRAARESVAAAPHPDRIAGHIAGRFASVSACV